MCQLLVDHGYADLPYNPEQLNDENIMLLTACDKWCIVEYCAWMLQKRIDCAVGPCRSTEIAKKMYMYMH